MFVRLTTAMVVMTALCSGAFAQERSTESKGLHDFFEAEWEWVMEQNPTFASILGERRYNDRWPDVSLAAVERRHRHRQEALKKLAAIDRSRLSHQNQVNYDLFRKEYELAVEAHPYGFHLLPVSHMGGIQQQNELADALRFTTVKDYEDWIARLRGLGAYMDQTIALMREGVKAGLVHPRAVTERVRQQIANHAVEQPEQSPYYKPLKSFPASIPAAEQQRLASAARQAISESVVPAFRRLRDFWEKEYLPASPQPVGAWQWPQGEKLYAFAVRESTTTDKTPDEIHQLGLSEVKRIRAEMEAIREKVGFKGTLKEFFVHLRSDPKFFYTEPDELLTAYRAISKQIDPHLVKVFKTIPRTPYGVEPIPPENAPDQTTAYYRQPAADGSRAGTYFVNLYKPESRPKWEMMALSLHEAVPGHHFQIALAQELGELPKFRRYGGYTAFAEGWGLYAESLGEEMGLYGDPYDKMGQLTYQMWRAVRLVVDTGMHSKRWTRQQAIDFFMENAPKAELDIVNEIDRYIAWPGQALAYKIGELKFKELRARARGQLGEKFDVREFHDLVLAQGGVPLDVLEGIVTEWIAKKQLSVVGGQKSLNRRAR